MRSLEPRRRSVGHRIGLAARRVGVTVVGCAVLVAGVAMLLLPGPGVLALIAGLAILATEYDWAQRAYVAAKQRWQTSVKRVRAGVRDRRDARGQR